MHPLRLAQMQLEANDALNEQGYDVQMESVNNVLFDYQKSGSRYTTGIENDAEAASKVGFAFHFINNLYLLAPDRSSAKFPEIQAVLKHGVSPQVKVHVAGNIGPNRPGDDLDPWLSVYTDSDHAPFAQADASVRAQRSDAYRPRCPRPQVWFLSAFPIRSRRVASPRRWYRRPRYRP